MDQLWWFYSRKITLCRDFRNFICKLMTLCIWFNDVIYNTMTLRKHWPWRSNDLDECISCHMFTLSRTLEYALFMFICYFCCFIFHLCDGIQCLCFDTQYINYLLVVDGSAWVLEKIFQLVTFSHSFSKWKSNSYLYTLLNANVIP